MPLKIVYLDDEELLLEILSDALAGPEIEIRTFSDPNQAIESIQKDRPDLAILDYRLPGTTGFEVAKKIDPTIIKVLLTGEIGIDQHPDFVRVLHKPFRASDLKAIIDLAKKT